MFYRRMPPDRALVWTILGAYMLLPPVLYVDPPLLPPLDKDAVANLSALFCSMFVLRHRITPLPASISGKVLVILFALVPLATALTNKEPLILNAAGVLPGLTPYEGLHDAFGKAIEILPLILARRYLCTPDAMRTILTALAMAGLIYSIPMLIEVRMSPQLNVWIYGYFQHDFSQTIRGGGFRPFVFMPHGLWVAFFALMAAMSALTLARHSAGNERSRYKWITLYLLVLLAACKTLGVTIYAIFLIPLILLAPRRAQVLVAAAMALVVITYPALRGSGVIPIDRITEFAYSLSPDRAQSFQFRVDNEEALLARGALKPLFGWGGFGRNLIFDPYTGARLSVADGAWIITLGIWGWSGYIAQFGLLVLPLLLMAREVWSRSVEISPWAATLCLIYAANLIDLLPNATLIPFTWLIGGALMGYANELARVRKGLAPQQAATALRVPAGATLPARRRTVL